MTKGDEVDSVELGSVNHSPKTSKKQDAVATAGPAHTGGHHEVNAFFLVI